MFYLKLLSFGEVLFDVFGEETCIGGAPLNLAAHASLQGADTYLLSSVGEDELGKKAICEAHRLGVEQKYISVNPDKKTGQCLVSLNEEKIPQYNLLTDVAYDYIGYPHFDETDEFDVLAFGTLALRHSHNADILKKIIKEKSFAQIYCDLNLRAPFYSRESILFCLENATMVKISDEELPNVQKEIFGKVYDSHLQFSANLCEKFNQIKLVIITCGSEGSYVFDTISKEEYSCDACKTEVVSTVGAGDSFGATFLVEYFDKKTILDCLKKASKISSYVVSKKEAVPLDIFDFIKSF